jgi:magnesium chelatase family protein
VLGTLVLVDALAHAGVEQVIVPAANAHEAALVPGIHVRAARSLGELHACLKGEWPWPDPPDPPRAPELVPDDEPLDLADVRGLPHARRALEVAAAGAHHLLMVGPPGIGKTMLARRLPTILPPLEPDDALEVTKIHSAAGAHRGPGLRTEPPFRAPHHSASAVALVGGGSARVRPGEVSLAHRGALFLDELPEFSVVVLEGLRQPLEERVVRISRAAGTLEFPADVLLVACANSCPCGRGARLCTCSDVQRARYARRLSAPLLDRFDLRLAITAAGTEPGDSSAVVATRVAAAVERQRARLRGTPWRRNAHIPAGALERLTELSADARAAWLEQCEVRSLTGRGAARIRRVARTLADLADRPVIEPADVEQAAWMREDLW